MNVESFDRGSEIKGSSDRSFGLVFAAVFLLIGLWPLRHHDSARWWAVVIGLIFGAITLTKPDFLSPLNRAWMLFGRLLGKIVTPVVMGILLYGVLTPVALIQRVIGRDALRLKLDPNAQSYWEMRNPPGPLPESMKNQF